MSRILKDSERLRQSGDDGFDDCFRDVKKWVVAMYENTKPFVLAHKTALVIAAVAILICILAMLAFNRYEFMNVNGNLIRVDRLTGETLSSFKGRGEYKEIEKENVRKAKDRERCTKQFEDMSADEMLRCLNGGR